jgi:SWI/SNF-related matrix-associated actin-dependent regulator of chromatin subfamily A3
MSGSDSDSEPSVACASEAHLIGFIIANIVGLRYYTGTVSGRELVVLSRQPLNPYDSNAIAVLNMRSAQVGHLERSVAATLAPLLDSHLALAEAIVPKPPGRNPKNPNAKPYRLPCQIHLFARPDAVEIVRVALEEGGLQLIQPTDHEFGLSQASILAGDKCKKGKKRDLDEIFALVDKDGRGKVSAMEPPKDVIVSELFQHQKEGLGWLFNREKSCDLPSFWEEKDGGFVNVLTNYTSQERPEPLRGGIFADDMGLGKTLTLLSLIATTKRGGGSSGLGDCNSSKKKRKRTNAEGEASGSKVTLVVCPPSVFSSWITQLEEHTRPGSLKVYLYHGERTKDRKQLLKFDIVLTTYSTLSTEFGNKNSPIKDIEWYRVILDEAHIIKNAAAQQTKAVVALKAERRWVVTGTPIQNSSLDLFSLMVFLRFQPFSIKSYWQSLIQRPLAQGSASGLSRLQVRWFSYKLVLLIIQ